MNRIDVCLSPLLFHPQKNDSDSIVIIVDVLRATSAFVAAFERGAQRITPVSNLEDLRVYKLKGYLTAAERDGEKVDFADFGNSPVIFLKSDLKDVEIAYSTTNGTRAIEKARNSKKIVTAAFINLDAVCKWISTQQNDVIILCSGWKEEFSLEDTLCAGAIIEILEKYGTHDYISDASFAALKLWQSSKYILTTTVQEGSHYKRLQKLDLQEDLNYCFHLNSSDIVPLWDGIGFQKIKTY